ncbi:carbamoyl phosphate synthase small subunit [Pseudalkalibacillus caeni]|uniref:Carbamoyl phosphate synthase small chain n=1 Tax=Exobacillus caeni TaxID=2574798 RepID=A0A5R9F2Y8_9BACL|nr:carbamoyl phosphate synthase small subunit [Pseudalkalibacillus caeni]TLS36859.1 carbamoyl phosphate synthase small subunit [Pseudalkalibacillus caeni]
MKKGFLALETGHIFEGQLIGTEKEAAGEVVFNTSMTGYQEIVTDPSYAGQIVTFCYPLIGNYGVNHVDNESTKLNLSGIIIGELCETPSHHLSETSFNEQLKLAGISGLAGIDTRSLVKLIRAEGTVKGHIVAEPPQTDELNSKPYWQTPFMEKSFHTFWVDKVAGNKSAFYQGNGPHVVLVDCGYKKSILDALLNKGCSVRVVPYSTTFDEINKMKPDGIVISNGPGDPLALSGYLNEFKKISSVFPTLGICLGHQLLALAYGATTKKLKFGHRGGNHPVKDLVTGKVYMTPQNHGYVVTNENLKKTGFDVTHINVNDRSIEGLKHSFYPIQTIQFHPESHPGPSDTEYLFQQFIQQLVQSGDMNYAIT